MSSNNRLANIESLRGLACLLLVYYHVVGPLHGGLKLELGNPHRVMVDALVYIRMPLFTLISGYIFSLYASRPVTFGKFLKGKARRLLFPLMFVGVPISLAQALAPGINRDIGIRDALLSVVYPINHFWFLQAVFLVFCVVGFLNVRGALRRNSGLLAVFAASVLLFLLPITAPRFFSINGMVYLFPFFMAGMVIQRFSHLLGAVDRRMYGALLILLLVGQLYLSYHLREVAIDRNSWTSLAVGLLACVLLYGLQLRSKALCFIGFYSFPIYLFHTMAAVAVRVSFQAMSLDNVHLLVAAELVAGIAAPIGIALLISRSELLSTLLLGERASNRKVAA